MDKIILNGKKVSLVNPTIEILSAYEQKVLDFCQKWQQGQETFSIFTSGSTGKPKEIILTRQQMEASALMTNRYFGLQKGDKILVSLSVEYIAGMMMLVRGLTGGLQIEIINPDSNPLSQLPPETHYDFTSMVPMQLLEILKKTPEKLPVLNRMKALLLGGAGVSKELEQLTQVLKVTVYLSYGMTETVSHIALRKINGSEQSEAFKVLEGIKTGTDQRGCLTIQGAVTDFKTVVTNDLAEFISPDEFLWLGRIDNVINSGGHKISLEKVEKAFEEVISELNRNISFLASSLPDSRLGQKLIIIFENYKLPEPEKERILEKLVTRLHKFEIPKEFFSVPEFRFTQTGKADRAGTTRLLGQNPDINN